jgi:hypothetical protein
MLPGNTIHGAVETSSRAWTCPSRELADAARGVVVVADAPTEGRVQEAEVEPAGDEGRVADGEVRHDGFAGEALAVHDDAVLLEPHALGGAVGEDVGVGREVERTRHDAVGVVVPLHDEDADAGAFEAGQAQVEKDPGVVVAPVAVEDVAGQDHEGRLLVDGELHQALERAAAGDPDRRRGGAVVALEPTQRAVEVQIGRVDEGEAGHESGDVLSWRGHCKRLNDARRRIYDRDAEVCVGN